MSEQSKTHTYKVGDRVRLVRPVPGLEGEKEGTVVYTTHSGMLFPVDVHWDQSPSDCLMKLSEIEPA